MRIVICDDDNGCCAQIEKWILDYKRKKNIEIEVDVYNGAELLAKHILEDYI